MGLYNNRYTIKMFLLYFVIAIHILTIVINGVSFLILPLCMPVYIWLPIDTMLLYIAVDSRNLCVLTRFENYVRVRVGLPQIEGFLTHYGGVLWQALLNFFKNV